MVNLLTFLLPTRIVQPSLSIFLHKIFEECERPADYVLCRRCHGPFPLRGDDAGHQSGEDPAGFLELPPDRRFDRYPDAGRDGRGPGSRYFGLEHVPQPAEFPAGYSSTAYRVARTDYIGSVLPAAQKTPSTLKVIMTSTDSSAFLF